MGRVLRRSNGWSAGEICEVTFAWVRIVRRDRRLVVVLGEAWGSQACL